MHNRQESSTGNGRLLTAQQVQDLLGVDASTVYRMASDGRLPAVKIGRQWRFRADRISALLGDEVAVPPARSAAALATAADQRPVPGTAHHRLRTEIAQPVVDAAADLLGVMMVVTDMSGRPLTHVANPCPRFTEHADNPDVIAACAEEWRELAEDLDFEPRFAAGHLGFECARAFVRAGSELVGMVLVGGIAPQTDTPDPDDQDLYALDKDRRTEVLASLRKVAVTLSRVATTDSRDAASVASPAS
jgi:excisionase family DNA binding protein